MTQAFRVRAVRFGRAQITFLGEQYEADPLPGAISDGRAPAPQPGFRNGPFRPAIPVSADAFFAFALFAPMLFIRELGSAGAFLFVCVTLALLFARRRSLWMMFQQRWYVLLVPAWALLSILWSAATIGTLKHSAEFAATVVAALLLAAPRDPRAFLHGLFLAFVLYTGVSVAVGHTVDVGLSGAQALSGLSQSKNEEANIAACGLLVAAFVAIDAAGRRKAMLCAIALAAGILEIVVSVAALSAGALAGLAIALAVLLLFLLLRRCSGFTRGAVLFGLAAIALVPAVLSEFSAHAPLEWAAAQIGKDPTLTGRTYLWYRARELIAAHPLLGEGFGAFWRQGNLDAEGLWQFAQITARAGFNFHNTVYDALVALGAIGTGILLFVFFVGLVNLMLCNVRRPGLLPGFWLCMAAYTFVRMPTECVGLTEFYFSTVLLYSMLGWGWGARVTARTKHAGGAASLVRIGERIPFRQPVFCEYRIVSRKSGRVHGPQRSFRIAARRS